MTRNVIHPWILICMLALYACQSHLAHVPCPYRVFVGFDCPTCGTTRAVRSLLIGDIRSAFNFNPISIILAMGVIRASLLQIFPNRLAFLERRLVEYPLLAAFFMFGLCHYLNAGPSLLW